MAGYASHTMFTSVIPFIPSLNDQNQLSVLKWTSVTSMLKQRDYSVIVCKKKNRSLIISVDRKIPIIGSTFQWTGTVDPRVGIFLSLLNTNDGFCLQIPNENHKRWGYMCIVVVTSWWRSAYWYAWVNLGKFYRHQLDKLPVTISYSKSLFLAILRSKHTDLEKVVRF